MSNKFSFGIGEQQTDQKTEYFDYSDNSQFGVDLSSLGGGDNGNALTTRADVQRDSKVNAYGKYGDVNILDGGAINGAFDFATLSLAKSLDAQKMSVLANEQAIENAINLMQENNKKTMDFVVTANNQALNVATKSIDKSIDKNKTDTQQLIDIAKMGLIVLSALAAVKALVKK